MVAHGFKYRSYPRRKGSQIEQILRPTVSFTASYAGGESWTEDALVDTGAPNCMFTHEVGVALGIPFKRPDADYDNFEILGDRRPAQMESIDIYLTECPEITWTMTAWFFLESWDWKLSVGGILGTDGFMTEWAVTFLRPRNLFVIADLDTMWQPKASEPRTLLGGMLPQPETASPLLQYLEDWQNP